MIYAWENGEVEKHTTYANLALNLFNAEWIVQGNFALNHVQVNPNRKNLLNSNSTANYATKKQLLKGIEKILQNSVLANAWLLCVASICVKSAIQNGRVGYLNARMKIECWLKKGKKKLENVNLVIQQNTSKGIISMVMEMIKIQYKFFARIVMSQNTLVINIL